MQTASAANGSMPVEGASAPASHNDLEVGFWFSVRSMDSGQGLGQAMFALYQNGSLLTYLRSDAEGRVDVPALPHGRYEWLQTQAPPGHHSDVKLHILYIGAQGDAYVDMHPARAGQYTVKNVRAQSNGAFSALCVDAETLAPLGGVSFVLYHAQGAIDLEEETSRETGHVSFGPLSAGHYALEAIRIPEGYMGLSIRYAVQVHPNGQVLLGGEPAEGYRLFLFRVRNKAKRTS